MLPFATEDDHILVMAFIAASDGRHDNAASHDAKADDADALDVAGLGIGREAGDARDFAFGGEEMAQCL